SFYFKVLLVVNKQQMETASDQERLTFPSLFQELPAELQFCIIKLSSEAAGTMRLVCKQWNSIVIGALYSPANLPPIGFLSIRLNANSMDVCFTLPANSAACFAKM
ncbi:hypothetical protein PFISCL1PPCAC_16933, partial [Pristionchus fissidentatus]